MKMKMKTKTVLITTLRKPSDEDAEEPPPSMQHFTDEVFETKIQKQDRDALVRTKRKIRRKKRLGKPPSAGDRAKLESRLKFAKASADLAIAVQRCHGLLQSRIGLIQSSNEYYGHGTSRKGKGKHAKLAFILKKTRKNTVSNLN